MSYGDKKLEGGHAASHNPPENLPFFVAPATGKEKNTFRLELVSVACWRLDDMRFDFDSSFVFPEAKPEFIELDELNKCHPNSPYSIFGHADPVGNDSYNKILSGRRARAVYGVMVRDAAIWEKLYTDTNGTGDQWGLRQIQFMLESAGFPPGNTSGSATSASTQAIRDFQSANGLTADGAAGPNTREKLFAAYFVFLSGPKLTPANFLAQGADPDGKGDYQGCSEFNPVMMFSASENAALQSNIPERNRQNVINRRVLALLFRPGTVVPPAKWPCPKWNEGVAGCEKRFFANSATRRQFQAERRLVEVDKDTFACRFYERRLQTSPCEGPNPTPVILEDVDPLIVSDSPEFEPDVLEDEPALADASAPSPAADDDEDVPNPQPDDSEEAPDAPAAGPPADDGADGKVEKAALGESAFGAKPKPTINPNHLVAIVPHVYTAPDPIRLILKTTADFDGRGDFWRSGDHIKFTVKGAAAPLTFNGIDNVFQGADLSKGVEIIAEAVRPSAKTGDLAVVLTLLGGSKKNGKPVTTKLTALQVTLDICEPRINDATAPVPLPTAKVKPAAGVRPTDKIFLGRPIPVQSDPKLDERAMLIVKDLKPDDFKGVFELTLENDRIELYDDEKPKKRERPLKNPFKIRAFKISGGKQVKLFVEGRKASKSIRSTGVRLGMPKIKGSIDRVNITVYHMEIVSKLEPSDVKTVDRVPEKPERKTKSRFFPAPIIMGRDYVVEMQPFIIPIAVPSAVQWTTPSDKITLSNATTNIVKVRGAKLSAKINDTDLEVLVTTNIGKLKKRHSLTVVTVVIDPVTSGDFIKHDAPLNFIKNPAGCVILTGAAARDEDLVPRYAITDKAGQISIEPDLDWGYDDERISWWIIGGEAKGDNKYDGKAAFMNNENAKRGAEVKVVGGELGDILIQPYSGGYGYGMIRAHVVPIKQVKYRINFIFTKAVPPALPGLPGRAAHGPTVTHEQAAIHMKIANIFLRQIGIDMIPDNSAEVAGSVANNKIGLATLDNSIVKITLEQPGHFDVEVNDPRLTFNSAAHLDSAIQINGRNEVISFAYIEEEPDLYTLAAARLFPANHAPSSKARQPEAAPSQRHPAGGPKGYEPANFTLEDLGTPASSLVTTAGDRSGVPPDTPAAKVSMFVLFPRVEWQPASPANRDVDLLWGIVVPTRNIDRSPAPNEKWPPESFSLLYGLLIAHEMGHVLGLGHRGDLADPNTDGLALPADQNIMRPLVNPPDTENFDIIQVKAVRFSELMARNP